MEIQEVQTQALAISQRAQTIKIVTKQDYEDAGALCNRFDELEKIAHTLCDPVCISTDKAHKDAVALRSQIVDPLALGRRIVKGLMGAWKSEQERLAKEQEAALNIQVAQQHQDTILNQAIAAETIGDKTASESILSQPTRPPTVKLQADVPKVKGVRFQTRYNAEVIDLQALVKAVANGLVSTEAVRANPEFLRKQAESLKETFSIPGCRLVKREC